MDNSNNSNFITYGEQPIVNIDNRKLIKVVRKKLTHINSKNALPYFIYFYYESDSAIWSFKEESERDDVFKSLQKKLAQSLVVEPVKYDNFLEQD